MATLREWLTDEEFDWGNGQIIYKAYSRGNLKSTQLFKNLKDNDSEQLIQLLDKRFTHGFGFPNCPHIIAKDLKRIYFPGQYDGMTWLESIELDFMYYMTNDTPYVGGG